MASVEVRKATTADTPALAHALTRSFHDDPVMAYLIPADKQLDRLRRFFAVDLKCFALPLGESYTTVGPVMGAALWAPPDKWKPSLLAQLRSAPGFLRAIGGRVRAAINLMAVVEKKHPRAPHYYLSTLGTDPDHQRKGVASAVMQPVLDRCDEHGIGAYLESSKEVNVPFYRRHGFEVTEELRVPDGPTLWLMWREPR